MEETNRTKEDKNSQEKRTILLFLILIALIIIIYLLIRCMGVIDHRPLTPTGNVDVFDIIFGKDTCGTNCNCNCNSPTCPSTPSGGAGNTSNKPTGGTNIEYPSTGEPSTDEEDKPVQIPPEEQEGFLTYDKDIMYSQDTPLNIFTQTAYYVVEDKIAPASENSYQFVVRNNNDFNVIYNLTLKETNKYNINMKYRLKLNGKYVVGNDDEYVTYDKLNQYNISLASRNLDVYTLDWKWFESSNDTEIGSNIEANYQLALEITASEE